MDDTPTEIQKNLIKIDSEVPIFKNNAKTTSALQEFVSNPSINKVSLNCSKPLLLKAFVEFVKKISKFSFLHVDALKIDNLENALRKSLILCIKSSRDVYEGEILDIKLIKDEKDAVQYIEMTLKSLKSSKIITLSKNLIDLVNDVNIGDVVYVEPNSGILKRIGRSETRINEYDLEGDKHVPLHKGTVNSTREKDIYISIYDLDYAFNKYNENISDFTRRHVDSTVSDYLKQGIAQFVCSGIYIENSCNLDVTNLYRLANVSGLYPHLKILIDKVEKDFLIVNSIGEENVVDVLSYFTKKLQTRELRMAVEEVANYENYEKVLAALSISNTVEEFQEVFN